MINFADMSADELRTIIKDAQAALAALESAPVRVVVRFGAYNERRYGLPWVARVVAWPVGARPVLEFGAFVGRPGDAGEAEIMARPGSVVRWGQKDNRNPRGTTAYWGIIEADGTIREIDSAEARKLVA